MDRRPSSSSSRRMSRETAFNKAKAKAKADRARATAANTHDDPSQVRKSYANATPARTSRQLEKTRATIDDPHPFRYKSFNDRLNAVHVDAFNAGGLSSGRGSTLAGLDVQGVAPQDGMGSEDDDDSDDEARMARLQAKTAFGSALQTWRELNLSVPFQDLLKAISRQSQSLTMLLHHREHIVAQLAATLQSRSATDSWLAYEPCLDLFPRLALDLHQEFLPVYPQALEAMLSTTMVNKNNTAGDEQAAARVVEKTFEAIAALFRNMAPLVAKDSGWMQQTWAIVRPYMGWVTAASEDVDMDEESTPAPRTRSRNNRTIPPHVRRFASEAFAHLLRRCKQSQLVKCANFMLADAETMLSTCPRPQAHSFATAIAGIWSELVKGVDKRLHSQCESQLSALLLAEGSHDAQTMIGNLLITSLVHHGQSTHLVPLYELLVGWSTERLGGSDDAPLVQSLQWLTTAVATRKGNRVDESVKPALFALVLSIAKHATVMPSQALSAATTALISFALAIGRIPDLVGPGIKIIDALWQTSAQGSSNPAFTASVLSLAEVSAWTANFRQFVLPQVLNATGDAIEKGDRARQDDALRLLGRLVELGHVTDVVNDEQQGQTPTVARWKRIVSQVMAQRVEELAAAADQLAFNVQPTHVCALPLVPLFASVGKTTSQLATTLRAAIASLTGRHLQDVDADSPLNAPMLLALLSAALAGLIEAVPSGKNRASIQRSLISDVCTTTLSSLVLEHLAHHRAALTQTLRLFQVAASIDQTLVSVPSPHSPGIAERMYASLMSEDEDLRRAAVGWLALGARGTSTSELYDAMATIESIPLRVETVRDRNVRLRSLARDLLKCSETSEETTTAARTITRYIVATLKLNFKPIWEESRKALADLVAAGTVSGVRFSDEVWAVAFEELTRERSAQAYPAAWDALTVRAEDNDEDDLQVDDDSTHESFKDPQRTQRRQAIQHNWLETSMRSTSDQILAHLVTQQKPSGRLDIINYRAQVLLLFSELPAIVEKHNAGFVTHFFEAVVEDDRRLSRASGEDEEVDGEDGEDEEDEDKKSASSPARLTVKERQDRLCTYLRVFNKFSNPKALYHSTDLHEFFYALAASGDTKLQRLGLECVFTWKNPSQIPYSEKLFALLDTGKFREELASLNLSTDSDASSIQPHDRDAIMPLVIRVLFGLAISRKGRNSAATSGAGKKVAILNALSGCSESELGVLVDLMSAPLVDQKGNVGAVVSPTPPSAFTAQQVGFLAFLADVIKHLGQQVLPFWPDLASVTINLAHHNSVLAAAQGPGKASSVSRDIRQSGIRRLADFFRSPASQHFDWTQYLPVIFSTLIAPRLPAFASENIQSPSALLDLFTVWSSRPETLRYLVEGDTELLHALYACLAANGVKNAVLSPILDIVDRILTAAEEEREADMATDVTDTVLKPYISSLVSNLAPALQRAASTNPPDVLLQREIQLLARIAIFVTQSSDATLVLDLLGPMMRKSNRIVPEKSKSDLLATFRDLLLLTDTFTDPSSELFAKYYDLFSSMWSTLRSRSARTNLGGVFAQISRVDPELVRVAQWVEKLNAFSQRRLDEVDFDTRLEVFDLLSSDKEVELSHREWQPVVHNMLFFIQDTEELVLRSNASAVLRRFVGDVAREEDMEGGELRGLFNRAVYPALRKMIRAKSEQVRKEVVGVIGFAVKHLGDSKDTSDASTSSLTDLHELLSNGDEESNFFTNIHHIQLHRRARALRRLGDYIESATPPIRSKTISEILLPLIGHFIEDGHTEIGDHNLTNETVATIGRLAGHLAWGAYNALLWRYLRAADGTTKGKGEKVYVRVALSILDRFAFGMEDVVEDKEGEGQGEVLEGGGDEGEAADGEVVEVAEGEGANINAAISADAVDAATKAAQSATSALATRTKIITSVTTKLLPALMGYLEQHDDETDDAIRLPIAVGVVRVVECLPTAEKEVQLSKLLTVLSNVFRSKSQETRDLARETLCKIAVALGPERLPQIVNEMRRSLTRGPQLAVLAYNVHSVLVHLMSTDAPLTYLEDAAGIDDIVAVAAEDVFGHTAEDREAVEYKTKQREMRSSKSLDTFEQLAKIIAPHRINSMILPLRNVMSETETPRAMKAVEDALRRIASGINANEHFDHAALLGLCHSLISRNAAFLKARKGAAKGGSGPVKGQQPLTVDPVLMKRKDVEDKAAAASRRDHYSTNAYRFVAFGLDLLVTALRRTRFDFADADVLSRLDPLVNAVGNTLYSADSHVLNLGLRAAGGLLRCPLPSLPAALPIFVRQTLQIINREANPSSDASQAGLRTLTIMLRDCPDAEFKEKQLADLLSLCLPEIEEPQAQSSIFGLLRAILGRRLVVVEVYDVMDKVAEMLVTNQASSVRESCRAIFLQFLLDYPQGKGRLRNQMEFLAKNLSYVFESGRMSVMELLGAVLAKFSDDVLREYSELLFVALVMVIANDDQTKCREKAAELGKALLGLVDDERRGKMIQMTHAWASNADKPELARVGLQVYGLLVDSGSAGEEWTAQALRTARGIIARCADDLEEAEQDDSAFAMDLDLDWQLAYHALQAISKMGKLNSQEIAPTQKSARTMWTNVRRLLLFPHSWVRIAACRLIGTLFASGEDGDVDDAAHPLSTPALVDTAKKLALQLKGNSDGEEVDDALALQIVKNLLWIGKVFAARAGSGEVEDDVGDAEEEDAEEEGEDNIPTTTDSNALANPLAWLLTKLSYQSRQLQGAPTSSSNPSGVATQNPRSILRLFGALSQSLSSSQLIPYLPHLITPLYRISNSTTLTGTQIDSLRTLAEEVQELLSEKVGSSAYSSAYARVRAKATEKRERRKNDKRGQEVSEEKRRERNEAKHASRKRKNAAFAKDKVRTRAVKRHRG